jgi:hypothetical protein
MRGAIRRPDQLPDLLECQSAPQPRDDHLAILSRQRLQRISGGLRIYLCDCRAVLRRVADPGRPSSGGLSLVPSPLMP